MIKRREDNQEENSWMIIKSDEWKEDLIEENPLNELDWVNQIKVSSPLDKRMNGFKKEFNSFLLISSSFLIFPSFLLDFLSSCYFLSSFLLSSFFSSFLNFNLISFSSSVQTLSSLNTLNLNDWLLDRFFLFKINPQVFFLLIKWYDWALLVSSFEIHW